MKTFKIKKGDQIIVLSGKDRGKKSKVIRVYSKTRRAIVEGINIVKRHKKPTTRYVHGGIIEKPAPLDLSNLALICPNCGKPAKVTFEIKTEKKMRVCKQCKQPIA